MDDGWPRCPKVFEQKAVGAKRQTKKSTADPSQDNFVNVVVAGEVEKVSAQFHFQEFAHTICDAGVGGGGVKAEPLNLVSKAPVLQAGSAASVWAGPVP